MPSFGIKITILFSNFMSATSCLGEVSYTVFPCIALLHSATVCLQLCDARPARRVKTSHHTNVAVISRPRVTWCEIASDGKCRTVS